MAPARHTLMQRLRTAAAAGFALAAAGPAAAAPPRELDRADYTQRLRGMWLAESIANWTGLRTEGGWTAAPFLTDANWGMDTWQGPITWVYWDDPWRADDDTDVEYIYLHLHSSLAVNRLTPAQIATGWQNHINRFIWVSNASARGLIGRGVVPPATSFLGANPNALMIDAQLTTEIFGALCPGMPERALQMADLPIRTTAAGYAAHAAQFYVVLYSLATQVDRSLPPREQALWLVREARKWIPDSSKSADICDFVLADFLSNPDPSDWERTRDRVAVRYQSSAAANGFVYQAWYESSVNFATGLIALLYGQLDFKRTTQIGTLSGWDSDNGTATMGGLIGLIKGPGPIAADFPPWPPSDRFYIYRTRDNLPDYLPADPAAEDTFTMMAQRMLPIVEREITAGGGRVDAAAGRWLLPARPLGVGPPDLSPSRQAHQRSANLRIRDLGGTVTASSSVAANPWWGFGSGSVGQFLSDGVEFDDSGREMGNSWMTFYSTLGSGQQTGDPVTLTVTYDRPVTVHTIRFIEGEHYARSDVGLFGGYFTSAAVQARVGGVWVTPGATLGEPLDAARPFQILDWTLSAPVQADAVRITGAVGGSSAFVTALELDALAAPAPPAPRAFDVNGDGRADADDLYALEQAAPPGIDLDGDGSATFADRLYLLRFLRWGETADITTQR
ncbi:MAG: ADP-ribosylglycohydrolase family protein [Phycisphaerales bacterium]|nr:ADP-ribosylglycohydrolase family protein [Phycisphaerales bacterium]